MVLGFGIAELGNGTPNPMPGNIHGMRTKSCTRMERVKIQTSAALADEGMRRRRRERRRGRWRGEKRRREVATYC